MKKNTNIAFILLIFSLGFFSLTGCDFEKNTNGYGIVSIDLGLNNTRSAPPETYNITSISVTISAADMETITAEIPLATGELTLEVPAGKARTFTIVAVSPDYTYSGTATQDIVEGIENSVIMRLIKEATTVIIDLSANTDTFTSLTVTISGAGMTTMENLTVPVDQKKLSIELPAGAARSFSIIGSTDYFTYLGSATQDLAVGQETTIPISLTKQAAQLTLNINDFYGNASHIPIDNYRIAITGSAFTATAAPNTSGLMTLDVPPGRHNLTISANINAVNPSAVTAATGSATTATLAVGDTSTLAVTMAVTATKLVIPDPFNNRLVQIDTMLPATANWQEMNSTHINTQTGTTSIPISTQFAPFDVEFDQYGRMYITNDCSIHYCSFDGLVIRVNKINAEGALILNIGTSTNTKGIALDKTKNIVYFSESDGTLYKTDYNLTSPATTLTNTSISSITGLAVEESTGILFIAGALDIINTIIKFDPTRPANDQIINNIDYGGYPNYIFDVIVKPPYIYISHFQMNEVINEIIRLNSSDLSSPQTLSGAPSPLTETFDGPRRFVATLNRKIYITDEKNFTGDNLISFDDITGANWESYGQRGITSQGPGYFDFFFQS